VLNPLRRLGVRVVRDRKHVVLRRNYYAPVPDPDELRAEDWERRSDLAGIELDLDAQVAFLRDELVPFVAEWQPARTGEWGSGRFYLDNGMYGAGDAELLYAMVRRFRPTRMIELGSGFTTLAAAEACERNAAADAEARYDVYDPHPRGLVPADATWPSATHEERAQDVPLERFLELGDGDLLIVDTTHVVKMGGDVNRVILDVLPRLARGVLVHFHDIWLPWEYHPRLVDELGFWNEQYLLQAYLSGNPHWRVVLAAQALARERRADFEAAVPALAGSGSQPTNFWIRRV
jgi:Methyltransferase domain